MKTIKLIILLFVVNVSWGQTAFQNATDLYEDGNYKKALKVIAKDVKKNGQNDTTMYLSYLVHFANKDYQDAMNSLNTAIMINPTKSMYHDERGLYLIRLGMSPEAIRSHTKAIEIAEDDSLLASYYCNRGTAKMHIRKYEAAFKDLMKGFGYDSLNRCILNQLGMTASELGNDALTLKCLHKMLELDSMDVVGWMNIGFFYSERDQYDSAIKYLDKSIAIEGRAYAFNNRGYAKLKTGDLNGAVVDVQKSISMDPYNSYAYRNLGLIYQAKDNMDKACEAWNLAIDLKFTEHYGKEVKGWIRENCGE